MSNWVSEDELKQVANNNYWWGVCSTFIWECAIALVGAFAWLVIHLPATYYPG